MIYIQIEKYAKKVSGRKKGNVFLFALSTCIWCMKTKRLLNQLGVEYKYIDVDLLEGEVQEEVVEEMSHWNPSQSFPTIVIDEKPVLGFQEEKIKELLG